jgi:peptidyl-tRNA hydrolase, PTH1 family
MILFYGLSNNDIKYLNTKHNVGRILLEQIFGTDLKKDREILLYNNTKYQDIKSAVTAGYMNNCGEPLADWIRYKNIKPKIIILQDDSDQLIGNVKISIGGGTAGHKGIISIYNSLKSLDYKEIDYVRIKIGIRPEGNKHKSETFVLSSLTEEEKLFSKKLVEIITTPRIWESITKGDCSYAMTIIN